jgi:DNA-binding transcriptional LysR family regulator
VQGDDRWQFSDPQGERLTVAVQGPWRSNSLSGVLAATRAGLGIAILPWYVARESLAEGVVVPVLHRYTLPAQELHAVYPSPKLLPAKVRVFIGFLQQSLSEGWWERAP